MAEKKKSILQEAIAEAKQVREAAINHAYKQLEENLTPSIKAMLEQKLEEEDDANLDSSPEENPSIDENTNSGFKEVKAKAPKTVEEAEDKDAEDEKEPDGDEDGGVATGDHKEPDGDEPEGTEDEKEPDGDEDGGVATGDHKEPDGDEPGAAEDDSAKIKDLTVGDLKALIANAVAQVSSTPAPGGNEGVDDTPGDVEGTGEEETPLQASGEPDVDSDQDPNKIKDDEKADDDEEIDLKEMLKELENEGKAQKKEPSKACPTCSEAKIVKLEKQNKLYERTIREMKDTLADVNLINAKLNCTTRILGAKTLSESQRAKIIRTFDSAKSVGEVKVIYKTINESLMDSNKALVTEHKEFASKAAGVRPKKNILEVDPQVKRWQKLAGIIKD